MNAHTEPAHPEASALLMRDTDLMVPHVTIHCFADQDDQRGTFEAFAADRRLRNAHVSIQDGGLAAAVGAYETRASPHLLIVGADMVDGALTSCLGRLADRCDPGTKVIILGGSNDISLYRDLMERGISDYFVTPVDPGHLEAAAVRLFCGEDAVRLGKVIAFIGAKGGAGNTTLAQNVMWDLSERFETDVLLADTDLAFGTLALGCDVPATKGIAETVRETERLDAALLERLMTARGKRLRLLTAPEGPGDVSAFDVTTFRKFLDVAQRSMPLVALDLPHQWNDWVRFALAEADQVVVTTIPTLSGIRNAASLISAQTALRPGRPAPLLIVNQIGMPKRQEISAREMQSALGLKGDFRIPFDAKKFGIAESRGAMLAEMSNSRITRDFTAIADRLSGQGHAVRRSQWRLPFLGRKQGYPAPG